MKRRKKAALVPEILRKTDKNIEQHQVDAGPLHAGATQAEVKHTADPLEFCAGPREFCTASREFCARVTRILRRSARAQQKNN